MHTFKNKYLQFAKHELLWYRVLYLIQSSQTKYNLNIILHFSDNKIEGCEIVNYPISLQ